MSHWQSSISSPRTNWFIDDFSDDEESEQERNEDLVLPDGLSPATHVPLTSDCFLLSQPKVSKPNDPTVATLENSPRDPRPQSCNLPYVAELVQNIFARLPFRDRVICTGVCKTWHQLLRNEPPTAYDIFLKPILKPPFTMVTRPRKGLMTDEFNEWTNIWHYSLNADEWCQKQRCLDLRPHRAVDERYINPVFSSRATNQNTCLRINGHCASFIFITAPSIARFLDLHKHSPQDASWRKMFLTNPPVRKFWAYSDLSGDALEMDDGIKLGSVAAYLDEIVARLMKNNRGNEEGWEADSRETLVERMLTKERLWSEMNPA